MMRFAIGAGTLTGAFLAAPLIAIIYLADQLVGMPFIPFDLFDWVARVLPGPLVTFGLDLMIDLLNLFGLSVAASAKTAERMLGIGLFFMLATSVAAVYFSVLCFRGIHAQRWHGATLGIVVAVPLTFISFAMGGSDVDPSLVITWLLVVFGLWGAGLGEAYLRLNVNPEHPVDGHDDGVAEPEEGLDRRQFVVRMGAATAVVTFAATGLGTLMAQAARREAAAEEEVSRTLDSGMTTSRVLPNAGDPVTPAPGTRLEYTAVQNHYQVFIRSEPTVIDGATWVLPISGLVENPVSMTLDDLRNDFTAREQYVTLSCISGRIGTDLISTTHWTGVSLQDVLAKVRPTGAAQYLQITCGDGFHEIVDLDLIASDERIMLCYAWDGRGLPIDHGFPLRIWLPDRYGMKQPKWITAIEVTDQYKPGYWVQRGWDEVARVNTVSVIDTVATDAVYEQDGQMLVPVGGIAFAGARGISKVEVKVGRGEWQEASLRTPLSETTWVLWRYDWPFEPGVHRFEVRCVDGTGEPQIERARGNRPSGATGVHSKVIQL
ncbi:MAG: molybdopterin-dependent oxidoreductase [Chloroflexi bacterium]|nr:molybdopterin-dependent oxidoreductase [Chloroflexota bacterium]